MKEIQNFSWSQKKLWSLNIEPEKMDISIFRWLLDFPIWATNHPKKVFDLSPAEVLDDIESHPSKKNESRMPICLILYSQ